jgi:competence protein CoiA
MNLFAFNENGELIQADRVLSKGNFFCLECLQSMGLRSGLNRRAHFYHYSPSAGCRQQGKTMKHLMTQLCIKEFLQNAAILEKRFPAIGRIADVVWEVEKIVFEVQCSPISVEEFFERTEQYRQMGYETVWILHLDRFEKEIYGVRFATVTHYFTDIDDRGKGKIIDILPLAKNHGGWISKEVSIQNPYKMSTIPHSKNFPQKLQHRMRHWSIGFQGDLTVSAHFDSMLLKKILLSEKTYDSTPSFALHQYLLSFYYGVKRLWWEYLKKI